MHLNYKKCVFLVHSVCMMCSVCVVYVICGMVFGVYGMVYVGGHVCMSCGMYVWCV